MGADLAPGGQQAPVKAASFSPQENPHILQSAISLSSFASREPKDDPEAAEEADKIFELDSSKKPGSNGRKGGKIDILTASNQGMNAPYHLVPTMLQHLRKLESKLTKQEAHIYALREEIKGAAAEVRGRPIGDRKSSVASTIAPGSLSSAPGQIPTSSYQLRIPSRRWNNKVSPSSEANSPHSQASDHVPLPTWLATFLHRYVTTEFGMFSEIQDMKIRGSLAELNSINERDAHAAGVMRAKYIMINPFSLFRQVWNTLTNLCTLTLLIVLPVVLAFDEAQFLTPLITTINFVLLCGVCVSLRTSFFVDGKIIMMPQTVLKRYAKSWLVFDIFSAFPYLLVINFATANVTDATLVANIRFISLLNVLRSLKLMTVPRVSWFSRVSKFLQQEISLSSNFLDLYRVIGYMMLFWHWRSCIQNIWWMREFPSRLTPYPLAWDRYTFGVFNAASEMLLTGFGVGNPETVGEYWYLVVNMVISVAFYATLIGYISSAILSLDITERNYKEKVDAVTEYMAYKNVPTALRKKVFNYFEFKYLNGKYFDEARILKELNAPLRREIALHNCKTLLLKVPFFQEVNPTFINILVSLLRPMHFLPGDTIIEMDTFGDDMFFIYKGKVEVLIDETRKNTLGPGTFFGEIAVIFGRKRRTATVRSVTHCILYSLRKSDLDKAMDVFPDVAATIRRVGEERLQRIRRQSISTDPNMGQKDLDIMGVLQSRRQSAVAQQRDDGGSGTGGFANRRTSAMISSFMSEEEVDEDTNAGKQQPIRVAVDPTMTELKSQFTENPSVDSFGSP